MPDLLLWHCGMKSCHTGSRRIGSSRHPRETPSEHQGQEQQACRRAGDGEGGALDSQLYRLPYPAAVRRAGLIFLCFVAQEQVATPKAAEADADDADEDSDEFADVTGQR